MTQPVIKKKLIEVALPLKAINEQSAREKSIRHGHPSTLHLWWARRPLAACRAVLFAQLVDDPSSNPEQFPTEELQNAERQRLFRLIERMVDWDNVNDKALFREAYEEIAKCFDGKPPTILDPFAGGGSIPLEAQRLGLDACASDLNPVAVLINKALIEIPPKFADQPPIWPGAADKKQSDASSWSGSQGLAEDVRRYGGWIKTETSKRLREHYPAVVLPNGRETEAIAWIWSRTVECPNPTCRHTAHLLRSFWLCKKKGRLRWLQPHVDNGAVHFTIEMDGAGPTIDGTVDRQGARCLSCGTGFPLAYIRTEGSAQRIGSRLVAIVADADPGREYLVPSESQVSAADVIRPEDAPETELPMKALGFRVQAYGMTTHASLFTSRQLLALTTLSSLVRDVRDLALRDAHASGIDDPEEYSRAIATYLAFAVSKIADRGSTICTWDVSRESSRNVFARQAISMTWDYCEVNPLRPSDGSLAAADAIADVIASLPVAGKGCAVQRDAAVGPSIGEFCVSTDPPYYDNIGYSDLSDYFYVWLRSSLSGVFPELLSTVLTPKASELIADPNRFDGCKQAAKDHFETGFVSTFVRVRESHPGDVPVTIFYAFKQAEEDTEGTASTGWETMLEGLLQAGLQITATWPMRTELATRSRNLGANALASSIVLACRARPNGAAATTRRGFITALKAELPTELRRLESESTIAPVDLPQAAIGPGMAVFSRFGRVTEADGTDMSVRTALALINQALDDVLVEQEGDLDTDSRFCVKWFEQYGFDTGPYGDAETMSRAINTSVEGLGRAGVLRTGSGKVALFAPSELADGYSPATDDRVSAWEVVLHLARALETFGTGEAGRILSEAGTRIDKSAAKELAFRLHQICSKNGWTESAITFNGLGTSWVDIDAASRSDSRGSSSPSAQSSLFNDTAGDDDGAE